MKTILLLTLLSSSLAIAAPQLLMDTDTLFPESKLTLSFSKPVVSPDMVGKDAKNTLIEISPALDAKLTWTAPSVAVLQLSTGPELGKSYTFTMKDGQAFADASPIEAGKLATLPAPHFQSENSRRSGTTRTPTFLIRFNDAVSPKSAAPYFSFIDHDGNRVGAAVQQGRWKHAESLGYWGPTWKQRCEGWQHPDKPKYSPKTEIPTALFIKPAGPLPIGKSWRLHLSPGIPNSTLTAVTPTKDTEWAGTTSPTEVDDIEAVTHVNSPRHLAITFNKSLSEKITLEEASEFITIKPTPANLKLTTASSGRTLIFHGDFPTGKNFDVQVKNGLSASDGLVIKETVSEKISFKNIAPRLAAASKDEAQLATGNRLYSLETVNLSSVRLRIKQLKGPNAVRAFQGYRHYTGDGHDNETIKGRNPLPFELLAGKVLADHTIGLNSEIDHSALTELNWNDYLPEATPFALLFVSLEGSPIEGLVNSDAKPITTQIFLQLTDIGLAWKINQDEAFVYAYSANTGNPLPHVKLDIFGEDSSSLHSTRTDADGVARLPRTEASRHLRANWGDDTYLSAFDSSLPTVSMWRFPVRYSWGYDQTPPRHTFIFTDRSLYRPGETVHFKGIVRNLKNSTFKQDPANKPHFVIRDSKRRIILEKEVTLSDKGSFDQSFTLPAETVGRFKATLSWQKEEEAAAEIENWRERYIAERNATFDHSFRVEEFRRNAFEVESKLTAGEKLGQLNYNLDANYYQGQPVAEGQVSWYMRSNSTGFYPAAYRDYLFCDHRTYDSYYWSHYFGYDDGDYYGSRSSSQKGELILDQKGHTAFPLDLAKEEFPSPRRVSITSEVIDARNQTLSSSASLTVHGSNTYLGVSRQDQLIRVGDSVGLQIVAVDREGKPSSEPVTAQLSIERRWNEQVKIKSDNGRISVRNESHDEKLGTQEITITPADVNAGGLVIPFAPTKPGRHTLTFTGTDSTGVPFRTAIIHHVYGTDEYPWAYESGMKIKLVPEKPNFKPGENARILVLSPIEGTALITLEREGVQTHFIRELRADNPVIEFPLTDANAPNVFASVLVIKGARDNKREVKEPILRLGYCELKVDNVKERLAVELVVPGDYHRPGEQVTVSGLITNHNGKPVANTEVTLYAEDEGTLAVMGYRTPNPLAYFYAPRQLRTTAGTSLGNFISESPEDRYFFNKGFFIGGGGDDSFGGAAADIEVREDFDPCAHWAPALSTGPDGKFTATFNSPDTLTRYRVIAVAHEGTDRFGSGSSSFVVDKPLMLEPSVPRFASEGDTLSPKVLVQNATDHTGTWEISLELDSTTAFMEGEDNIQTKTITLKPQSSTTISYDVKLLNTGETDWTWSARPVSLSEGAALSATLKRDLSDAVVSRFEVSYPMPILRESKFIRFQEPQKNNRNLLDGLNKNLLSGRGELELQFGKSLLLEAGGAMDHLLRYPYGCIEQTTSSTIPWITALHMRGLSPELSKFSEPKIRANIQAGANRLLSMQTSDGGFSYWPGDSESLDWASSYAGLGILLCKEAGAKIPDEALNDLTDYLEEHFQDDSKKPNHWNDWNYETTTRGLFVLALAGKPQHAYHNHFLDQADKLGMNARYFLALAIHQAGGPEAQKSAQRILDLPAPKAANGDSWMRYRPSNAYRLLATNRIRPSDAEAQVDKLLAGRTGAGHWRTTWCNAWAIYAIGDYASRVENYDETATIELVTADGTRTITLGKDNYSETVKLPLHADTKALLKSTGSLYVRTVLAAKPPIASQPPVSKGGFQIARTYHRVLANGKTEPLKKPKVGDLIEVQLEVLVPADNSRYLVVDDPLPSLFEAVNTDFKSQSGVTKKTHNGWRVSHQELRDDRAVFFLDRVYKRGSYKLSYHARVTSAGEAVAPPAKIEAMYDPQSYALTASRTFKTPNPIPTASN